MKLVAIHQPNFFPWLGYFDKVRRADVFVLLDNVQFQKTGGTWSNRVMLNMGGQGRWVTAPVIRNFHGVRMINEIEFNDAEPWRERLLKTLHTQYRRAPGFVESFELLEPLISSTERLLCKYNQRAILTITERLGLDANKFVLASSLQTNRNATELLVEIVRAVDGTHYLAGGGAAGYQQDELFSAAGIGVVYQSFVHPIYPQIGGSPFVPGLSVIDAMMNCGAAGAASLLGRHVG